MCPASFSSSYFERSLFILPSPRLETPEIFLVNAESLSLCRAIRFSSWSRSGFGHSFAPQSTNSDYYLTDAPVQRGRRSCRRSRCCISVRRHFSPWSLPAVAVKMLLAILVVTRRNDVHLTLAFSQAAVRHARTAPTWAIYVPSTSSQLVRRKREQE